MMRLFDNPFSPFTRKVRMALAHKGIAFESIDGLALAQHERLMGVNPRGEVPALDDDGFLVVNSSDIVAYLEHRCPEPRLSPADPKARATARAWERRCDTVLDSIIHDISIWTWPTHARTDSPPAGLLEIGRTDILAFMRCVESALPEDGFLCGELSIADLALFPHASSLKFLGIELDPVAFPKLVAWNRRMRSVDAVRADLDYVKRMAFEKFGSGPSPYEGEKVVWRGDRLEWLFARGFHGWWFEECRAGRTIVPAGT